MWNFKLDVRRGTNTQGKTESTYTCARALDSVKLFLSLLHSSLSTYIIII